ncbi:hypothetical protein [Anabaena azotica]|uniref:Uncharacterized protein n=1 Tax=Anabaena azotica FACHB-119 TaxID=947527 RepID=A0ABR8CWF8_9NOST|nr:hypothetical protein [Anabaena azotica]MBD2499263.1 hypothetical protein [Anabaena azotica FACHB-119]
MSRIEESPTEPGRSHCKMKPEKAIALHTPHKSDRLISIKKRHTTRSHLCQPQSKINGELAIA